MWSDNESAIDLYNVQHLVAAVASTARNQRLLPVTIGVYGDWGSGKSTVVRMVKEQLEREEGTLCVYFNGWLFEGYEDAKAAIIGSILDELADQRGAAAKAADLFNRLRKRVNWFRLMGWGIKTYFSVKAGLPAVPDAAAVTTEVVKAAADGVEGVIKEAPEGEDNIRRSVREFHEDFQELLKKTEVQTLVVFVDDLDRCLPTTVIETLEAIRLFVFVKRTAFVISADERLVRHAVQTQYRDFADPDRDLGREYLEKLVQVPIHVPALSRADIATYLNLLFAELHLPAEEYKSLCGRLLAGARGSIGTEVLFDSTTAREALGRDLPAPLAEDLALAAQIADVLATSTAGNPRQTKRFLNALLLRLQMAEARGVPLQKRVTAKLMLLEYYQDATFRALARWQSQQDGQPVEIAELEAWRRAQDAPREEAAAPSGAGNEKVEAGTARKGRGAAAKPAAPAQPELSPHLIVYTADPWMREWLALEPQLAGVDLRPYFYFAREKVVALQAAASRLSPAARAVLSKLLSESAAYRANGARDARDLNAPEASAVLVALGEAADREEDLEAESSAFRAMFQLVESRGDLAPALLAYLAGVNVARLRIQTPPRVMSLGRITGMEGPVEGLLVTWATQPGNPGLAEAAKMMLERPAPAGGARPSDPSRR
jgi:KAP family P-loop domain